MWFTRANVRVLLQLTGTLVAGVGTGLAGTALAYQYLGRVSGIDTIAHFMGAAIGFFTTGTVMFVMFRSWNWVSVVWRTSIAVLLGVAAGLPLFSFGHSYPSSLDNEVADHLAPGLGLLICGLALLLHSAWFGKGPDQLLGLVAAELGVRHSSIALVAILALASILGAGAGLLLAGALYVVPGGWFRSWDISGSFGGAFGCWMVAVVILFAWFKVKHLPRFWTFVIIVVFLTLGVIYCMIGVQNLQDKRITGKTH